MAGCLATGYSGLNSRGQMKGSTAFPEEWKLQVHLCCGPTMRQNPMPGTVQLLGQ